MYEAAPAHAAQQVGGGAAGASASERGRAMRMTRDDRGDRAPGGLGRARAGRPTMPRAAVG